MAEVLVSTILEQLTSLLRQQIGQKVHLVAGLNEKVEQLAHSFRALQPLLEDAEIKQLKDGAVGDWLERLRNTSYDIDDVLDEWSLEIQKLHIRKAERASMPLIRKVCSLISSPYLCIGQVVTRHDIAVKIANLNRSLDIIVKDKDRFNLKLRDEPRELEREITTSMVDVSEIHGRDSEKDKLLSYLLSERSDELLSFRIISIVGMGGIGKTTLARLAFNDKMIDTHFDEKIWVCVSDPFDEIRIAKAILESLKGRMPDLSEYNSILKNIHQSMKDKKFLLVLDDVWAESPKNFEQLKNSFKSCSRGSRILVTTRKEKVANAVGTTDDDVVRIGVLSFEECWSLFRQISLLDRFGHDEHVRLEVIGRKIVTKCKGLPLVVKVLGGLLRFKREVEEWQKVLGSDLWELEEAENEIFAPILLSYNDLPSALRKCFSYCAIFPKDHLMDKKELIRLWMAQDYLGVDENKDMEIIGERYFESLAARSFFQDFQRSRNDNSEIKFKLHDILHDFAQYVSKNEFITLGSGGLKVSEIARQLEKARHALISDSIVRSVPSSISVELKLRSFLASYWGGKIPVYLIEYGGSKLAKKLTCLRALDIKGIPFDTVLWDVRKMIHLRNLNLEGTSISEIPATVCTLYNLQSLDVSKCIFLHQLPEEIGKLVKLRHLIDYENNFSYMAEGIERLSSLRSLPEIVVVGKKKAFTFRCLQHLNRLQGSLRIKCKKTNADAGEANDGQLHNKKDISNLSLIDFEYLKGEDALNGFQPPPNLERLVIRHFRGSTTSLNWVISLNKLKKLDLISWMNCEVLPPLGRLPFLETLQLDDIYSLKVMHNEILGISATSRVVFPKLESLEVLGMSKLEEWDDEGITDEGITIIPCLRFLEIWVCPKLKKLPDYLLRSTTLEKLDFYGCPGLKERYGTKETEEWIKISHIPNVRIDGHWLAKETQTENN